MTNDDPALQSLSTSRVFSHLPDDLVRTVLTRMTERAFAPGECIVRQGEEGDSLLVLLEGGASAVLRRPEGEQRLAQFGPGDVVGEMALITQEPRVADVVADGHVVALRLAASDFDDLALENPELGVVLSHVVADRFGAAAVDGMSGKVVDRYRVVGCVGRGAMGVVYDAVDTDSGEHVALKMMSHRLLYDPSAAARFQREADLLRTIDHPNVARLLRRFRAYRTHFLAMELCSGGSLAARMEGHGPWAEGDVRRIVAQLASALVCLHGRGLVHRDLKPANVLLADDGSVKLSDFGLARPSAQDLGASVTTERAVIGTPLYMAPEQLTGERAGAVSDVYALGCMAYEMLAGRNPFRAGGFFELVEAKRAFRVPAAAEIGPGVGPEMHAFLAGALAPTPAERHVDLVRVSAWV